MTEMAILFDSSKCTGCKGCQVACKCWNNLPSYMKGANAKEDFTGTYQNPPDLNGTTRLIMTFDERDGAGQKPVEWAFGRRSCRLAKMRRAPRCARAARLCATRTRAL